VWLAGVVVQVQIVNRRSFIPGLKEVVVGKMLLAPQKLNRLAYTLTVPSLATLCLAAPCLSHRSGAQLLARPLVMHLCGTPLAPAAASLCCELLEEIEPKLMETSIDGDALTLSIVSVGVYLFAASH
jgi:hypothetical protein